MVSTAEAAEELLKHKDADFTDRDTKMTRSARKYTAFDGEMLVFANYDDELKLHRKLLISELMTAAKLKTYEALRTEEVAILVENIIKGTYCSNDNAEGNHNATISAPVPGNR